MRKVNKLDYCNYEYLWICSFSERAVNTGSVCVPSFKLQCVWGERDQSKAVVVAYRRPTLRKFAHINNRLTPNFRVAYTWKDAWDIGSSSYQSYGWHKKTVCYWVYRKTKHNILEIWYTCTWTNYWWSNQSNLWECHSLRGPACSVNYMTGNFRLKLK